MIPLYNYDFWWHLATGKYIVENRSIPQDDPFSYTTLKETSRRKKAILKGNWLSEVIFYKIYNLWRFKGIIILRSILLLSFLTFIFLTTRRQSSSDLLTLTLIIGVFLVIRESGSADERPQLFTFLIFSIVYYLLEDFRINGGRKVYLIPLLVMILSNMHPGYIVCLLLISIYLTGEAIHYLSGNTHKRDTVRAILIIWTLTILSSTLNPNGPMMLTRIFSIHGEHTKVVVEWMSPFYLYLNKIIPFNYIYISFLLFSLLGLRSFKKVGITHILLLIVFTIMGIHSIRYMIFYMGASTPILAGLIINLKDEKILTKTVDFLRKQEALIFMTACIIGIFLIFNTIPSFAKYEYRSDTAYFVPEGAADFLSKLKIKGNMFNEYGFGGYLIWRLYPDKKVFIDGRGLETSVLQEYMTVMEVREDLNPSWKDIIKKHDISYIVTSPLEFSGKIFPLVEKLFDSKEWTLIYKDHLTLIFVLNNSGNDSIINRFAINKREILNTIIAQASARALSNEKNPNYLISIGKAFMRMGRLDEAKKAFMRAYQRDPNNEELKFWMRKLYK